MIESISSARRRSFARRNAVRSLQEIRPRSRTFMRGWLGVVVILGVLACLLAISLLMLAVRRRWLDRLGGTFDCSLRLRITTPGAGWVLGLAVIARNPGVVQILLVLAAATHGVSAA